MTYSPANAKTAYLPTSRVFEVDDDQELKLILNSSYTDTANAVNLREIAQYEEIELLTGKRFFTPGNNQAKRDVFRKCFQIGAIAPGATLTFAHGITGATIYTEVGGGVATAVVDYRPVPWASATLVTDQIQIRVVGANVEIVNGATAPAITSGIVVLEYLKN